MKMDPEKLKALAKITIENFKGLETELMAYRMVFHGLKTFDPSQAPALDQAFQISLNSPVLQKQMYEKYDVTLEKFLKQVDEGSQDQDPLQWFRDWKAEGPKN
jgi:hypothetical protein